MATEPSLTERFARNVAATMKAQDVTLDQLVTATGIAKRTLARRMTGNSPWNSDEMDLVARALGVEDARDLMTGTRTPAELPGRNSQRRAS